MKRKVPSPPPPPLPPAKPRRAGLSKVTRSSGHANINDREGRGGGEEDTAEILSSRRRNNHRRKDSIPIPAPTHKYTTTNPSTKSPVYHLVYDLTSPPSPDYKQTLDGAGDHTADNSSVTASTALNLTGFSSSVWSSTSPHGLSKPGLASHLNRSTSTSTHLPVQGRHGQVDCVSVEVDGEGRLLNGLQVRPGVSNNRGGARWGRSEDESDTGIASWGRPASVSSPPVPGRIHNPGRATRIREQNETTGSSAVPVNGDSDSPPPLPPPRLPTIINANGDAADATNWDTVTNNSGPFFNPRPLAYPEQQAHFLESAHNGYEANALRLSYRKNFSSTSSFNSGTSVTNNIRSCDNSHLLSHTTGDNTDGNERNSWSNRRPRDSDRSQTLDQAGEDGGIDWAGRGTKAEFPSVETPSFLLGGLPSPRLGVRHELRTADATGISSSVAPSSGCVPQLPVFQNDPVNSSSRTLDGHRQVCFIGREEVGGEGCQVEAVTRAVSVRDQLITSSGRSEPIVRVDTEHCEDTHGLNSVSVPASRSSKSLLHSGKDCARVRFACDIESDSYKPSSADISRVSESSNNSNVFTATHSNVNCDVLEPKRISVKDAVSLWGKPNSSNTEKSSVFSWSSPQCIADTAAESEPDHHLKKAVFHRQGDSLRFFINHNDSGVVSDNDQSDANNPPVSLESYVDPITGKPIVWIIPTDSKNAGKSKQGSKNDKHTGIISKVLDLTLSRGSGNANIKTTSLSLLSSFSSSKATKVSNTQHQVHRPRPPVNRWDNIHVRTPQTHSASRPSEHGHVNQTFQIQQDNTAPALPPRQPSSSSLHVPQQQQQQLHQPSDAVVVSPPAFPTSPQGAECGAGDSCVTPNKCRQFGGDVFYRDSNYNASVKNTPLSPTQNNNHSVNQEQSHAPRLNHSHDRVLHLDLTTHQTSSVENSSFCVTGLNTGVSSGSRPTCNTATGINAVTHPKRDESSVSVSSIIFDNADAQQLRSYYHSASSPLRCPHSDPFQTVTAFSDRKPRTDQKEGHVSLIAENTVSANTRPDFEISSGRHPGGYKLDQCKGSALVSNDPTSTPPPPPLPARGLSQHKNLSSSISFAHKQQLSHDQLSIISLARLKHTDGDSPLSDSSKHATRRGELISFDHIHKVDHFGDLPELTSGVEQCPNTEAVLFNSPVSITRTANSLVGRAVERSPIEDKLTYQRSVREECKKNQLWNLYGFDLKENHWIKSRLSSNNNNPIGLQQLEQTEPILDCREERDIHVQHRRPAKITPRQKFEILHNRVSEKVATNFRRPLKNLSDVELEEVEDYFDPSLNRDRPNYEINLVSSTESRDLKYIAALNLAQSPNGSGYKESPRARFERDRAARASAVNTRTNLDPSFPDAAETSVRLNRSCDELETETFGSRPGSDTSFLANKASFTRSFSPTQDVGHTRENWAPPIPPKPSLCQRLPSEHLESLNARSIDGPSCTARDNKGDKHYESSGVNHGLRHDSDNRIPVPDGLAGEQCFSAGALRIGEASVWAERSKQQISSGNRDPLVELTNKCSEKSVHESAPHASLAGDTSRRVEFSLPVREARSLQYVQSPRQTEPVSVADSTGTGQWSGPLTNQANRYKNGWECETENFPGQQSATGLVQERGQYKRDLACAEIQASDNTISAGVLQTVDCCKKSSHFVESSSPSSSCVSQSKSLLAVRADITTNLDPDTQGQQSCAQTQAGSVSDPQASFPSHSSEPRKGLAAKKMSPGSVTSSGYESELNSATQKLDKLSGIDLHRDVKSSSTVQQLRLRFGHNTNVNAQFPVFKSKSPRKYNANNFAVNANGRKQDSQLNSVFPTEAEEADVTSLSRDLLEGQPSARLSAHHKLQTHQHLIPESPARLYKASFRSSSPRLNVKEEPHNKRVLKKVSRSMHGIIHDLNPDNRRSPSKLYRSCQHKTQKRKLSRGSPSKLEAGGVRAGSRSASASSECTICGEEVVTLSKCDDNENQLTASKSDRNNNVKATYISTGVDLNSNNKVSRNVRNSNPACADIDTYNINTANNFHTNSKREPQIFPAQFFSGENSVMLASKGLRIYESGEEYIAMRSPVKSPLLKSMSAPQFGWEGAHYLIVPTVNEPFSPDLTSLAANAANLNLTLSPSGSRSRSVSDEHTDYNTNTLLTHRSISDSGASRRCSASRFDDGIDASDFFTGHRSDGDDYDDETNGFNDINYNGGGTVTNNDDAYLPMRERKLSARHRAMSVDVLYRERPEKTQSDSEPLSPARRHMMRRFFQPHVDTDKGRGYVEWKTCSGWVGKVDMRNAPNGRNSRGYVEWDTIWTAAAPWGAKEDDEHVYDVIAENSSTCSTEDTVPKITNGEGERVANVNSERPTKSGLEMKLITSVSLDTPPALPERTYINKIKNTRLSDSNDNASSSASSSPGNRHHHHHPHCKKHHHRHHHHHHHHSRSHNHQHLHHIHHRCHHHDPQQQHQSPPQRPAKPSNLNISALDQQTQQQQQQSPSTSSPLSTPTKSKAPPIIKPPPKPPRQQHLSVQNSTIPLHHQQQQQPPISTSAMQSTAGSLLLTTSATQGTGIDIANVSENYSEVHKLKGYKFTSLLTAVESDSPVPQLIHNHAPDPNAIYSETYWHLGPAIAPQARATVWQSGDVLDYIDGLHDSMSPKRRENIYILLNNKKTRAKFSESLEIESRLLSKGLLSPSPSSTASASSSSPLPPSSVAASGSASLFPSFVTSRFPENSTSPHQTNEVTPVLSPVTSSTSASASKAGSMAGSALTTPTVFATSPARIIKRKGATAPVSSTYV
ncbi:hypothetical protein ElyMa_005218600 [Elysia marginata]|uniref:Uncharacterized protein n=1 Tax=Elysia marginata TaxID=1093978 RepID=A0AAV4JUW8_9GAST|nr:hypothetical protein ElyMa_005218600 [Elysia marginata]